MLFEPTPPSSALPPEGNQRCPRCGAAVTPENRFCTACGAALTSPFPIRLEVEYPQRLSRLSTFFRLLLALPVFIVLYLLSQSLIFVYWIGIVVRGRPVRWLFDANVATQRFSLRTYAYFLLLTDRYPPLDGDWPVRYEVDYPERLSRWRLVIWKTATVIPHMIVLGFVSIAIMVVVPIAWFAVLFTGRYPRGLHTFVSGSLRWYARATAYWVSFTDEFPSFSLSADAGRGSTSSYVISAIFGWLIVLAWVGGFGALAAWPGETEEVTVSYEQLLQGEPSDVVEVFDVEVTLLLAEDPYVFVDGLYVAEEGDRFVRFKLSLLNLSGIQPVGEDDFQLRDSRGKRHDPFLISLGGLRPPQDLFAGGEGEVFAIFEIAEGVDPAELVYSPSFGFKQRVKFILE